MTTKFQIVGVGIHVPPSSLLVGKHKGEKYATRYLSGVWGLHAHLKFL